MEDWKYQVSIKTADGQIMINARGNTADEFDEAIVHAKDLYHKHFALTEDKGEAPKESPAARAQREASDYKKQEPGECKHAGEKKPMSGTSAKGPWKGEACKTCNYVRFQDKKGNWGGWMPGKGK